MMLELVLQRDLAMQAERATFQVYHLYLSKYDIFVQEGGMNLENLFD
jgi:hypothetical protein